ncbi:hypothetical protein F4778DRAFT_729034 [Xylariomycetidae sp. FL2044]|nr:hypothetical protein F4778DRAFT_729034 [Xylariomycetidae sp. FL2044]
MNEMVNNLNGENPRETPSVAVARLADSDQFKSHERVLGAPPNITRAEQASIDKIAKKIIRRLESESTIQLAEYWKNLVEKDLSLPEMADDLWNRSLCKEDSAPVRWANHFYSSCMRYILRQRGLLPHITQKRYQTRDRAAALTNIINMAADKLYVPDCQCGIKIYTGLAACNHRLSELSSVRQEKYGALSNLLASKLQSIAKLPGGLIYHPATVISILWKESFHTVCTALKLFNLAKYGAAGLPHLQSNTPRLACRHLNSIMDCVNWSQLRYPTVSEELTQRITSMKLGKIESYNKKRFVVNDPKEQPPPVAYEIFYWPQKLQNLANAAAEEVNPTVHASFPEKLKWTSALVLIKKGGMRAKKKAYMSLIIPIQIAGPSDAKVQFDRGRGTEVIEIRDWLTLPPVTFDGDIAIRMVDHPIALVWIRWYSWKKYHDDPKNQ